MTISAAAIWCVLAIVLLGAEMMSGTFYLLVTAVACFAAAALAFLDMSLTAQLFAAGMVTLVGACFIFYLRHRLKKQYRENLDNLDKGQRVQVGKINADGSATVNYRGTTWTAVPASGTLSPGWWEIERADGPRLILARKL
ncbi:MAG: hypothetical protein IAA31_02055 [Candidatus Anaerobiospirillum merdipullorum]|uniref:NfeD family protein n=1 Tax=Candidatus Anaerobiospirillum merdipullorum TaxID=2838450 RepID=A0A9E2NRM2_9GAMM|nr:hypothetical protein [Candidatus Anaerobiospirillum merdipullorum]